MAKARSWYSIEAKAGGTETELFIYDDIGAWGVTASDFVRDLSAVKSARIVLRINSRGGDVFDGFAIYNSIKKHPAAVATHIEGLAASISSVIALAGDTVDMAENAFFMVHNPYTISVGDAANMRKTADVLDKIRGSIVDAYAAKTGLGAAEVEALMDEESWYTAREARKMGFVDAVMEKEEIRAGYDLSVFNNVPQQVFNALNISCPSPRKLEYALREAGGLSNAEAKAVVTKGYRALNHREDEGAEGHREDDKIKNTKEIIMDLTQLKAEHPDLVADIESAAREGYLAQSDIEAVVEAAKSEGAAAEVARIRSVKAQLMTGHEGLIEDLMFDGKTTGPEAAVAVLDAERKLRVNAAADFRADGRINVPNVEPGDDVENTMKRKNYDALSTMERKAFRDSGGKIID